MSTSPAAADWPNYPRRRDGGDGRWRQGSGAFPSDVQALDIDFTPFPAISAGRPGSAPCTAKASCWQRCRLARRKMIAEVSFDGFTPQPAPYGLRPVRRMSPGLSASAPRWSGWRKAISVGRGGKLERSGERRKRNWRNGRASALSAASSQACWPLNWGRHHSDLVTLLAESGIACAPDNTAPAAAGGLRGQRHPAGLFRPWPIPKTMLRRTLVRGGSRPEILVD